MDRRALRMLGLGALALLGAACEPSREELIAEHQATLEKYCLDCHSQAERAGGLALEPVRLTEVASNPDKWERVIRKLRAGIMPPAGELRPEHENYAALASFIESEIDAAPKTAGLAPPGLHRLNRVEYGNAIRDLLALDIDAAAFLPADDVSRGFDNQAGTLALSPALLEAYLGAAGKISRLALGRAEAPTQAMYRVAADATQNYHVEGLPFGTRGGILIDHTFPVDAEYNFKVYSVNLGNMGNFRPFGEIRGEQLEILLDGARVALVDWDQAFNLDRGFGGGSGQLRTIDVRVPVTAGPHQVGVTFLATNYAPGLDINRAFERSTIETGGLPGFSFYPHIGSVRIDGPYDPTGVSDTPSRQAVLACTPDAPAAAEACAREILTHLARRAYRGNVTDADVETLLEFYRTGSAANDFEAGIELALQRLLTEPKFIYRIEHEPAELTAGEVYAVGDLELASRLSFFLWSSIPDEELLALAEQSRLRDPAVLAEQTRRMLADPRSEALTANFAGQWLNLRALDGHVPVAALFPDFDDNLRQSFRKETELLFDSLIRENRPVTELITADYTFVDERLAKHYGIPGVYGSRFQRVTLGDELDARRGLLGKGSLLATSSQPVRTSPVIRGYWVLQNLLGVPPPPPPEDVPDLPPQAADAAGNTRVPTMREQMETHRANPACVGCHQLMDPIGLALEQFDAIGRWRTKDGDNVIDATSVMYDGTPIAGPADLRAFLLRYEEQFVRNVTERLLTYALGRGTEYDDMPVVRGIAAAAAEDDNRFQSLIVAVVQSEPFLSSRKPDAMPSRNESEASAVTAAVVD
ncbi:MAG TPA: DUF1592 domain-containing protein [Gammaproteobacteria bacterium]|nr:DUF1592 domain-containing protein [Gammaproteobacteria bacterium]